MLHHIETKKSGFISRFLFLFCLLCVTLPNQLTLGHTDLDLQIKDLNQAITDNPENAALYVQRGNLHRRHGDWRHAREDFDQVRLLQPENDTVDFLEGRMLIESGDLPAGIRLLDKFLANNKQNAIAYRVRAKALKEVGRYESSTGSYREAIYYSNKVSAVLFKEYIDTIMRIGIDQWPVAAEQAIIALNQFPRVTSLRELAVELNLGLKKTSSADALLAGVPEHLAFMPRWTRLRGQVECQRGDFKQARLYFKQTLDRLQNDPRLVNSPDQNIKQNLEELIQTTSPDDCRELLIRQYGLTH